MLWMEVACLRLKGCVTRQQGAGVWAICGVCGVCGLRFVVVRMRQRRRACDMRLSGCDGVVALACGYGDA